MPLPRRKKAEPASNDLRSLLQALNQPPQSLQDMPHQIDICHRVLEMLNRSQQSELWAALEVKLGNSLAQNLYDSRAENIEQAIYHYQQALKVYTREAFPEQWAMTQNDLANACADRILVTGFVLLSPVSTLLTFLFPNMSHDYALGEQAENIEQAIYHYQQALEVYIPVGEGIAAPTSVGVQSVRASLPPPLLQNRTCEVRGAREKANRGSLGSDQTLTRP